MKTICFSGLSCALRWLGFILAPVYLNAQIELQQYQNGAFSTPVNTGTNWLTDNAGPTSAHYLEGWSIPYRCVMTGLPANSSVTLTLGYDIKNSGRHAIDFLTHYNRLEPHNFCSHHLAEALFPTAGVSGITGPATGFPIPEPTTGNSPVPGEPGASFNNIPSAERQMTLFGATLTGISYQFEGDLMAGQSETSMDVTFNTDDGGTVVLAWGGHIASRADWGISSNGAPRSAGGLNGVPYQMRLKSWTVGALPVQNRSISGVAVGPASELVGANPVCAGTLQQYCLKNPQPGENYLWSVSGNGSISGPDNGACVQVAAGSTGTFDLTLMITIPGSNNLCVDVRSTVIVQGGLLACTINGPSVVCPAVLTSYCGSPGANAYNWSVSGAGSIAGGNTLSCISALPANTCSGSFTANLTITDNFGCKSACSKPVTIADLTAPNFTSVPGNLTVSCFAVPGPDLPTATDNCAGPTTILYNGQTRTDGNCPQNYTLTRRWTATDNCGNTKTATQLITVQDPYGPQFLALPQDAIEECNPVSSTPQYQAWLNNHGGATAQDCGPISWTYGTDPGHFCPVPCGATFFKPTIFTATDACGNSTTAKAIFWNIDQTPPKFSTPPQNKSVDRIVDCDGEAEFYDWLDNLAGLAVEDNCGAVEVEYVPWSEKSGCGNTWSKTYQFRATDECGNISTAYATFSLIDTTPPVITFCPPGNYFLDCKDDIPLPDPAAVIATDNCSIATVVVKPLAITGDGCSYWPRTVIYWYVAMDACGNTAFCDQTFIAKDDVPPAVNCPANATVACEAEAPACPASLAAFLALPGASATDNCDTLLSYVCIPGTLVGGPCGGTITHTFQVRDDCGNTGSCAQVITVNDTIPPAIACPAVSSPIECPATPAFGPATATDNCAPAPEVSFSDAITPGTCPQRYSVTRTWTARDACQNIATCSRTIEVQDNSLPLISCPTVVSPIECPATPTFGPATATDACDPAPDVNFSDTTTPGTCPQRYSVTRTWTAKDACGNTATCSRSIVVQDNIAPLISCPTVISPIECPATPTFGAATAIDACDPAPVVSISNATIPGTCPQEYSVTRTWTASDACGNTSACSRTIVVQDNTAPLISCPTVVSPIECPATPVFGAATATDACDPAPAVSFSNAITPGSCPQEYSITRIWTAEDACKNTASCSRTIAVQDNTPPLITCPTVVSPIECPATPTFGAATATDACDPVPDVTILDATTPGSCPQEYSVTRTWTARDACGNTASCSRTIQVLDTARPVITCPANITVECLTVIPPCPATLADFLLLPGATASDLCDPALDYQCSDGSMSGNHCSGTLPRTHSVKDDCGNSNSCVQIIFLIDNIPPKLICKDTIVLCVEDMTDPCTTGFPNDLIICKDVFPICPAPPPVAGCFQSKLCPVHDCVTCATMWFKVPRGEGNPVLDSCSDVTLTYCDPHNSPSQCTSDPAFLFVRTWVAEDECGNISTCTQVIVCNPDCFVDDPPADFGIFPNPTYDVFTVQLADHWLGTPVTIQVFNQLGQLLVTKAFSALSETDVSMSAEHWPGGMYQVVVWMGESGPVSKNMAVVKD